ncbi:BLUF domain-containing protein [Flavobacterium channae]|uniref:BLUF domain-containing protein n=1 Tax=Flavobacterium channae TaxID=2897181 RepID=UPI001E600B6D|nr:BLUF domain-containing protein [Flavobacterium channae]UGS22836.1 BLUF domain-containing protein [Flavobacterium channae]
MQRIIYLSSGVKIFSDEEINELLNVSRVNNQKSGITGLLLYSDGNFMQILEGKKEAIENTYSKILTDSRHRNIILISNETIKKRNFSEWKMGYSVINPDFLKKHPEINPFKVQKTSKIDTIITTFIETFLNSFRNTVLYN